MARFKPQDHKSLLLPVVLSEQIIPGSFAFALNYLVDNELDLTPLDAKFKNDESGASAYDPRVMLKIVLLAYSQGIISSRGIWLRPWSRPSRRWNAYWPGGAIDIWSGFGFDRRYGVHAASGIGPPRGLCPLHASMMR